MKDKNPYSKLFLQASTGILLLSCIIFSFVTLYGEWHDPIDSNLKLSSAVPNTPEICIKDISNLHSSNTILIGYHLQREMDIKINLYTVNGRFIDSLWNGQKEKGDHSVLWNGINSRGNIVLLKQLIVRFESDSEIATKLFLTS